MKDSKEHRQVEVPAAVHTANDKIFFQGKAHITESDADQIESELKRQESIGVADSKVRAVVAEDPDMIPSDFPHAKELANNGVTSMIALEAMSHEDLMALKGIGDAYAAEIEEALG